MVRWRLVLLAVTAVWVVRSGYLDAVGAWFGGASPRAAVWPLPMVWWGRAGKVLQFLGALTALLDLVGPQRLRDTARRALGRLDEFRSLRADHVEATRIERLKRYVAWAVGEYDALSSVRALSPYPAGPSPFAAVPDGAAFTLEDFAAARRRFNVERREHCAHRGNRIHLCAGQRRFLAGLVDGLVEPTLTVQQQRQRQRARTLVPRNPVLRRLPIVLAVTAACLVIATACFLVYGAPGIGFAVLVCMLTVGVNLDAGSAGRTARRARLAVTSGIVAAGAPLLADLLDAARPGNRIRWAAFALFVAGFHFDLLAS